jgi:hypothetical protein
VRRILLTRIGIGGTNGNHVHANGRILVNFVGIAHGVKHGCIVVQIENVTVDCQGAGQAGMTAVLSLNDQNVVLDLE